MSAGDFLQVLLGGLSGGATAATNDLSYQRRRKDKLDDAIELSKATKGSKLDEIVGSILAAGGKQAVKDGRTFDFGTVMAGSGIDPALLAAWQAMFGRGGAGGSGHRLSKPATSATPASSSMFGKNKQPAQKQAAAPNPWSR